MTALVIDGLSHEQVAEQLQITPRRLDPRSLWARRLLRANYKEQ